MAELLSLKWNNHKSTFFHVLATIRSKESYSDVTVACDGRFYSLHKFVLSTCSEYFEEMFERTQCKHPVIVLKDINSEDLEALLNYMYVGEVNVVQEKLAGLIKAAECLKIKGLAVPDEDPMESKDNSSIDREQYKRSQRGEDSPRAKKRRRENSSEVSEEILSPVRSRPSARSREHHGNSSQSAKSANAAAALSEEIEDDSREVNTPTDAAEEAENSSINANRQTNSSSNKLNSSQNSTINTEKKEKVTDERVKVEPEDSEPEVANDARVEEDEEQHQDDKTSLHQALGLDMADDADFVENSALLEPPQTMEEVVAEVIPGAVEYQTNSFLWEGDGSLSAFSAEGFSGDSAQSRQTITSFGMSSSDFRPTSGGQNQIMMPPRPPGSDQEFLSHPTLGFPSGPSSLFMGSGHPPPTAYRFNCVHCGYSTNHGGHFKDHKRVHTNEKPFACHICTYRSNVKSNVNKHLLIKHGVHAVKSKS